MDIMRFVAQLKAETTDTAFPRIPVGNISLSTTYTTTHTNTHTQTHTVSFSMHLDPHHSPLHSRAPYQLEFKVFQEPPGRLDTVEIIAIQRGMSMFKQS